MSRSTWVEEYLEQGARPYLRDGVAHHDAQRHEPLFVGQCSHDVLRTIVGVLVGFQNRESILDGWIGA